MYFCVRRWAFCKANASTSDFLHAIILHMLTLIFLILSKINCIAGVLVLLIITTTVFGKHHHKKSKSGDPPRCQGGRDGPCFQCLYDCLYCVETYGKSQYDGHACSTACRSSNGEDKDSDCSKHMKED